MDLIDDEYTMTVEFRRFLSDDQDLAMKRAGADLVDKLVTQLVLELQEAYDKVGIPGTFQVKTITLKSVYGKSYTREVPQHVPAE